MDCATSAAGLAPEKALAMSPCKRIPAVSVTQDSASGSISRYKFLRPSIRYAGNIETTPESNSCRRTRPSLTSKRPGAASTRAAV